MTNNTAKNNQLIATSENTVFITVAAYEDHETKTAALCKSAEDYGVSLIICDVEEPWRGFYYHKIEKMSERLKSLRDAGQQFAFILDCRDVVFIDPLDVILAKFNAINDGRIIFNHDSPGGGWPSDRPYLAREMERVMNSEHARPNAGMIAGSIETISKAQHIVIELRRELKEGCPRLGILEQLYQDIGTSFSNDDQYLYQICLTYFPELFQIDYDKELFSVLLSYPKDIREYSDDPKRHDVINNAAIVHSPWLSRCQEWNDWAIQNRWQR